MSKINSLESLRGIAAFIVALYHIPVISFYHYEKGLYGVYFFFSLSGFVIALNYFHKIKDIKSLYFFKKKRFLRLYPVHFFLLFTVLFIQIGKIFLLDKLDISYDQKAFEPSEWFTELDFLQHIFLTQAVTNLGYSYSWHGSSWTISTEFYSYLIFGIILIISRNNQFFFSLLVIPYILFFNEIIEFLQHYINYLFLECLRYFFMGTLMYLIFKRIKLYLNDLVFLILLITILILRDFFPSFFIFSFIILIVALQKKENICFRLLNQKYLVYFGTISYSFYMIHTVIYYLFNQFLKILNINFYSGKDEYNFALDTFLGFSYIFLSTISAIIIYKFIENKFRYKKN